MKINWKDENFYIEIVDETKKIIEIPKNKTHVVSLHCAQTYTFIKP
jgi:hypothetical protein